MPASQPIGLRIKRARERKRLSQRQLADELGVNVKSVDNWENGRTSPRSSIGALEAVLEVDLTGEPAAEPGPLDDLLPWTHDWERQVAEEEDLPVHIRRRMISDWRAARSEAQEHRRRRQGGEPATAAG